MVSLDREFNVITEFKNELKPEDIKIFLYSMPIKDINERTHTDISDHCICPDRITGTELFADT